MDAQLRKVTITLPPDLVAFADHQAQRLGTNRSHYIAQMLADLRETEKERLAAEGYRLYSAEAASFAEASAQSSSEVLADER